MKKKHIILIVLLSLLTFLIITVRYEYVKDTKWIDKQIFKKDDTFKKTIFSKLDESYIYAFYKNDRDSIGFALIEVSGNKETHILGSVPITSNVGISLGTGESKQLKQYILYGVITNKEITQVLVNENPTSIFDVENFKIWYFTSETPFLSMKISAINKNKITLFETKIY